MNTLTVPLPVLRQALRDLRRHGPSVRRPVGLSRWAGHQDLLIGPPRPATGRYLLLALGDDFGPPPRLPRECAGVLTVGTGRQRGRAQAFAHLTPPPEPIDRLKIIGPGMHVLSLRPARPPAHDPGSASSLAEKWSRTSAALGPEVWARLTGLHYGVVGVGRSGSILAEALAAGWGVQRLSLIDPDVLETHNLGEMAAVTPADRGQPKVEALARRLRPLEGPRPAITPTARSITHLPGLRAAQPCDVLFGCLDHDGARLALAALAVLFCKPCVDLATGIHGTAGGRRLGADVRLLVPGERCLLCLGGLADPAGARHVLTSADAEQAAYAGRDWRQERAGSLRSLNQLAVSLALRLWEDFIAERVTASTWAHAEFDPAGRMSVAYPQPPAAAPCRLCPLLGLGEGGLPRAAALFQEVAAR
jgi:hypothetical protein